MDKLFVNSLSWLAIDGWHSMTMLQMVSSGFNLLNMKQIKTNLNNMEQFVPRDACGKTTKNKELETENSNHIGSKNQ